jgi:organic radical activating enzyme
LGGEFLHRFSIDDRIFLEQVKSMGCKIKIDTNGTNPGKLSTLMTRKLVDYVAMDVKVKLLQDPEYRESVVIVKDFIKEKAGEFRLTCYPREVSNDNIGEVLYPFFGSVMFLQQFKKHNNAKLMTIRARMTKPYTLDRLECWKKMFEDKFDKIEVRP